MNGSNKLLTLIFVGLLGFFLGSCKDKKDDKNDGHGCPDCGPNGGPRPSTLAIDLQSAVGIAVLESDGSSSLNLDGTGDSGNLIKIDDAGNISSVIKEAKPDDLTEEEYERMGPAQSIPRVVVIGFSPTGEIYAIFERAFYYQYVENMEGEEAWSPSSQYTCQIFRLKSDLNTVKSTVVDVGGASNLECVTATHEIPTWSRESRLMQFDSYGNLYFPARVPGGSKEIFYKYNPVDKSLAEMVNANINFRDVEVTPTGSIFYTGTTGQNGGDSFFRYISNSNKLVEVARDWWDFKYGSDKDPTATNERIIFYGPDPSSSSVASWDSACLYRFDPALVDSGSPSTKLAKCLNNIWDWIEARELTGYNDDRPSLSVRTIKKTRCESDGQVFIGGSGISQLQQKSNGEIFIVGELRKKKAGTYQCNVEIKGEHCSSVNPTHSTQSICEAAGYVWKDSGGWCDNSNYSTESTCTGASATWNLNAEWYNDVTGNGCISTNTASEENTASGIYYRSGWSVRNPNCQQPTSTSGGDGWTDTIKGLAYVDNASTTDNEKLLALKSEEDEKVTEFWIINLAGVETIFYTSYKNNKHYLSMEQSGTNKVLLTDYEVYNLSIDPNDSSRLLFDGLKFSTNTYRFGTINPGASDVEATITDKQGLTGQIQTLIIVP